MSENTGKSIWEKIAGGLRNLKEDMYKDSVAAAGPSDDACCHKPVEELERQRNDYRRLAAGKAKVRRQQ